MLMRYTVGLQIARKDYVVCARRDIVRDPGRIHYWVKTTADLPDTDPRHNDVALFTSIREADSVAELLELDARRLPWKVSTIHL